MPVNTTSRAAPGTATARSLPLHVAHAASPNSANAARTTERHPGPSDILRVYVEPAGLANLAQGFARPGRPDRSRALRGQGRLATDGRGALLLRGMGLRNFNERYWTTVGRTIYYPAYVRDPRAHPRIIDHELVHVHQWERLGPWLWASYLLLPLPFWLAWFRFRWEREAYLPPIEQAEDRDRAIARVVDTLWFGYGLAWPRPLMRRWFKRDVGAGTGRAPGRGGPA